MLSSATTPNIRSFSLLGHLNPHMFMLSFYALSSLSGFLSVPFETHVALQKTPLVLALAASSTYSSGYPVTSPGELFNKI